MNTDLLIRGAEGLGIELPPEKLKQFLVYQQLLEQWGERINLTAIHGDEQVIRSHFLDSLALLPLLQGSRDDETLVDVGSGAGFPGMICAMMRPAMRVTLVERVQKKAAFLLTLRRELGLDVEVVAEDIRATRRCFQIAVSRAAFPPEDWISVGARLVEAGGALLVMLSAKQQAPTASKIFFFKKEVSYDVGLGPRRIQAWRRSKTS